MTFFFPSTSSSTSFFRSSFFLPSRHILTDIFALFVAKVTSLSIVPLSVSSAETLDIAFVIPCECDVMLNYVKQAFYSFLSDCSTHSFSHYYSILRIPFPGQRTVLLNYRFLLQKTSWISNHIAQSFISRNRTIFGQ